MFALKRISNAPKLTKIKLNQVNRPERITACMNHTNLLPINRIQQFLGHHNKYSTTSIHSTTEDHTGLKALDVTEDTLNHDKLIIRYNNGTTRRYPKLWLRMHCQCSQCYDVISTNRKLRHADWKITDTVEDASISSNGGLCLIWSNGHKGEFRPSWLYENSFDELEMKSKRQLQTIPKELWSTEHKLREFQFSDLLESDSTLFSWLVELESNGATLVKQVPRSPDQGVVLAQRVGLNLKTMFGDVSNVVLTENANNIAYTDGFLDLHNDLPFNDNMPGVILLNMVRQHKGEGGDTIISDGIYVAELMRVQYPDEFSILANTEVYHGTIGVDMNDINKSKYEYNRLNKSSVFTLDGDAGIRSVRYNNHVLRPNLDIALSKVTAFIRSYKLYGSLLYEHSICRTLNDGEMLVLDNTRCQHGRTAIKGESSRHLATSYMSWDDVRCRRRVLNTKLN